MTEVWTVVGEQSSGAPAVSRWCGRTVAPSGRASVPTMADKARRLSGFNNSVLAVEQDEGEMLLPEAQLWSALSPASPELTLAERRRRKQTFKPSSPLPAVFERLDEIWNLCMCGLIDDGINPPPASINKMLCMCVCACVRCTQRRCAAVKWTKCAFNGCAVLTATFLDVSSTISGHPL